MNGPMLHRRQCGGPKEDFLLHMRTHIIMLLYHDYAGLPIQSSVGQYTITQTAKKDIIFAPAQTRYDVRRMLGVCMQHQLSSSYR